MKIVVCVKQVPDTWAERMLRPEDATLDRDAVDAVLNELDEYAVEEALRLAGQHDGEVTVLSMGPSRTEQTIRKALSMGADAGIHVLDDAVAGSDAPATASVLAQTLRMTEFDLVILGSESTDARTSVVPAMVAEQLGLPQLTYAVQVTVEGSTVRISRQTEYGHDVVEAVLPAVVSVVEKINEPRYPSFKGIMAAKKKPVTTLSLADIGVAASEVGLAHAWTTVRDFAASPPRQTGTIITDEGDGGRKLAEFLAARTFI